MIPLFLFFWAEFDICDLQGSMKTSGTLSLLTYCLHEAQLISFGYLPCNVDSQTVQILVCTYYVQIYGCGELYLPAYPPRRDPYLICWPNIQKDILKHLPKNHFALSRTPLKINVDLIDLFLRSSFSSFRLSILASILGASSWLTCHCFISANSFCNLFLSCLESSSLMFSKVKLFDAFNSWILFSLLIALASASSFVVTSCATHSCISFSLVFWSSGFLYL